MGYKVDEATTPEAMLEMVAQREYDRYLMDLNLGRPNSPDINPALRVYEVIRKRVETQKAKFIGMSTNQQAVQAAREQGVPAEFKTDFKFMEFLK